MKQITVVFRCAPHFQSQAREGLDFAMLAASMEQQVSLVFVDEGVFNLLVGQQPEQLGNKDYLAAFKAVDFYDIAPVMVSQAALHKFQLRSEQLSYAAQIATDEQIRQQLVSVDEVIVF